MSNKTDNKDMVMNQGIKMIKEELKKAIAERDEDRKKFLIATLKVFIQDAELLKRLAQ